MDVPISGVCAAGFEQVRDAFAKNFAVDGEIGASVHVIQHGRTVADLWGGWTDETRSTPWQPDTIVDFYSVGKALLGVLVLQLVDQELIDLDTPIAEVWPEFAAGGKATATVRHAITHTAGVPAIREEMTDVDLFDWERMTSAIALTQTWWPPGERLAYHTNTYGHILGEIVHRVTGDMPGAALAKLAKPLEADVHFGVADADLGRCAQVIWSPPSPIKAPDDFSAYAGMSGDALMSALAHLNPPGYSSIGVVNTTDWRQSQIGSTSGHGSASGIARIYAALLEQDQLLSPDLLRQAGSIQVEGHCPILDDHFVYGLGFQPTTERRPFGPNPHSFGHFGTGGALGFADPDAGIAFGYVMNRVIPRWQASTNRRLMDAVYSCVADL